MPTPTYIQLATGTVSTTGVQVFTLSSISSGYRDLVVIVDVPATSTSYVELGFIFNSDTAFGYNYLVAGAMNSAMRAGYGSASNIWASGTGTGDGAMATTATGLSAICNILDYAATDKRKTVVGKVASGIGISAFGGQWPQTTAINSVSIMRGGASDFPIGTKMTIYGIGA